MNNFKVNYQKLADASAKSKNYLAIKNINIPNDVDFEGNKHVKDLEIWNQKFIYKNRNVSNWTQSNCTNIQSNK